MSEEVKINEENQYSFENPEYRKTYWHTCSHGRRSRRTLAPKCVPLCAVLCGFFSVDAGLMDSSIRRRRGFVKGQAQNSGG